MKIGSRVRLAPNKDGICRKAYGHLRGMIVGLRDGGCVNVRWENGRVEGYHASFLIEESPESFPFRSHRTMAEVIADEQKPEPA